MFRTHSKYKPETQDDYDHLIYLFEIISKIKEDRQMIKDLCEIDPPNSVSMHNSKVLLFDLFDLHIFPEHISYDADGGLIIYLRKNSDSMTIFCDNDGEYGYIICLTKLKTISENIIADETKVVERALAFCA
jgi:hypothetical protein